VVIASGVIFFYVSRSFSNGADLYSSSIGSIIFISSIIGAILGGLTYIFALYELENKIGRYILYAAFAISIMISGIIGFFFMDAINEAYRNISSDSFSSNFTSFNLLTSNISGYSVLGIISNIFWLIAIYIPYKRIKDGELIPHSPNV
jgi:tetrahydromethanopterin S-methyltransferase subunit D